MDYGPCCYGLAEVAERAFGQIADVLTKAFANEEKSGRRQRAGSAKWPQICWFIVLEFYCWIRGDGTKSARIKSVYNRWGTGRFHLCVSVGALVSWNIRHGNRSGRRAAAAGGASRIVLWPLERQAVRSRRSGSAAGIPAASTQVPKGVCTEGQEFEKLQKQIC